MIRLFPFILNDHFKMIHVVSLFTGTYSGLTNGMATLKEHSLMDRTEKSSSNKAFTYLTNSQSAGFSGMLNLLKGGGGGGGIIIINYKLFYLF